MSSGNSFEYWLGEAVRLLTESGIDLSRAYVSGGAALHAYLIACGEVPVFTPSDIDVFIEPAERTMDEDMEALLAVTPPYSATQWKTRIQVIFPGPAILSGIDYCFMVNPPFTAIERIRMFDISVCKVYFRIDSWRQPAFEFADTAKEDIRERRMRISPTLHALLPAFREYRREERGDYIEGKLLRICKYTQRGFREVPDPKYEFVASMEANDWDSALSPCELVDMTQ